MLRLGRHHQTVVSFSHAFKLPVPCFCQSAYRPRSAVRSWMPSRARARHTHTGSTDVASFGAHHVGALCVSRAEMLWRVLGFGAADRRHWEAELATHGRLHGAVRYNYGALPSSG